VKLMLHALRENTLPFISGGHHVDVPEIPTWISLIVIAVVLAVTTVASLLRTRHLERQQATSGSAEPGP
jgi:tellurite resistance protein TerC